MALSRRILREIEINQAPRQGVYMRTMEGNPRHWIVYILPRVTEFFHGVKAEIFLTASYPLNPPKVRYLPLYPLLSPPSLPFPLMLPQQYCQFLPSPVSLFHLLPSFTSHFCSNSPHPSLFLPNPLRFLTKVYHPNVDKQGRPCLDITHHRWSPALTIEKVIFGLSEVLSDPNPYDPMDDRAGWAWMRDRAGSENQAREISERHGIPPEYFVRGLLCTRPHVFKRCTRLRAAQLVLVEHVGTDVASLVLTMLVGMELDEAEEEIWSPVVLP
jgi:ubiquitin-protein ligase